MIKKRLVVDEDYNIVDTVTGEWLDDGQMFDLVNELNDENMRLKGENAHYKLLLMSLEEAARKFCEVPKCYGVNNDRS